MAVVSSDTRCMIPYATVNTTHTLLTQSAAVPLPISDHAVDLIVTSPPYPMIKMWDEVFCMQSDRVHQAIARGDGHATFEAMHELLDSVWDECFRTLRPGGIACINIGDATRTIGRSFALYPNHARVVNAFLSRGMTMLPSIHWNKPTNIPTKFLGSGMLPGGAYVSLEHEHILVFRKGGEPAKAPALKQRRRESAYFWEERNTWFSDTWRLIGQRQALSNGKTRARSGAFPFEVAFRLINMYSIQGAVVLDPFVGTGTTMIAAGAAGRSSVGVEIDESLSHAAFERLSSEVESLPRYQEDRLRNHLTFVEEYTRTRGQPRYTNTTYNFPVMTRQEVDLKLLAPNACWVTDESQVEYHHGVCMPRSKPRKG